MVYVTRFGKTCLYARTIFSDLLVEAKRYRLPFVWCNIRCYTRCGFDQRATYDSCLLIARTERDCIFHSCHCGSMCTTEVCGCSCGWIIILDEKVLLRPSIRFGLYFDGLLDISVVE